MSAKIYLGLGRHHGSVGGVVYCKCPVIVQSLTTSYLKHEVRLLIMMEAVRSLRV